MHPSRLVGVVKGHDGRFGMRMMNTFVLIAVLGAPQFDVQTLDGGSLSGAIAALDDQTLVVEQADGKKDLNLKDLLSASAKEIAQPRENPAVLVELSDGSRIAAAEFQSANGNARIRVMGGATHEMPVKALRYVRFFDTAESSEKLDAQWNEFIAGQPAGDLLVTRKKGAMDSTDGVVGDVTAETVAFTLDGDTLEVKRSKVAGLVFAHAAGDELPEIVGTVTDIYGSRFRASAVKLDAGKLEVATPLGFTTAVSLSDVAQLDFSSGKVLYLSDLDPESFTHEPFFGPQQPIPSLNEFYRLRRDVGLERNPLKLDGRLYRKGIAMHSRSVVVYRLPGRFRLFKALAGIDDAARAAGGDVALEIQGDGKSLWKGSIRGSEAAHALELAISGVKRLEIVADFGEGQDVADHLDLCEARVTK